MNSPLVVSSVSKHFPKNNLLRHTKSYTGERPFSCYQCLKAFSTNTDLKKHVESHTDERPYLCNQCSKAYSCNRYLKKHLLIHTE